jgi:hypothetical protein
MNFWMFVLGGVCIMVLSFFAIVVLLVLVPNFLESAKDFEYRINAWRHNRKARKLRLERETWEGYPLPTGKRGQFVLTPEKMINLPPISNHQLKRVMEDRAHDLGVALEQDYDPVTMNITVRWYPASEYEKRNSSERV